MADFDHFPDQEESGTRSRVVLIAVAGLAIAVVVAGIWWLMRPQPAGPETAPVRAERETPDRPAAPTAPPPPPPEAPRAPTREARPRPRPAPEAPVEAPSPEPTVPAAPERELIVEADVEGAQVFLDRNFLGTAPVRTRDVTPGSHQLNVSAQGFDGVAQSITIAESGQTNVTIRLREVRLNESVDVVHKHAMGSCQGRLVADLNGFRYAPQKGDDGFTMPLGEIEGFEIDYLKKNLRIRRKGGRTWNFESPTGTADPLFVFHRDVEKARAKLAASK